MSGCPDTSAGPRRLRWIGHGGASALAPSNTLSSFRLAAQHGVDVIEFDVRYVRGRLLLAHTMFDAWRPGCLDLDTALRWVAEEMEERLELLVDLKTPGSEYAAVALRRYGFLERAVLSSQCPPILERVRDIVPSARTAISVAGRLSRLAQRWGGWRARVLGELGAGRFCALLAHRGLVDRALVDDVRATGAELYAWTVSGARDASALARIGVDGIVTADPRLVAAI